jgi:transcriptional regulator with XRE-family HTH domain
MPLTPRQIEELAENAGKSMRRVCEEAGIAQSTFSRWKAGDTEPTLGVYRRILAAVSAAEFPTAPPAAASQQTEAA